MWVESCRKSKRMINVCDDKYYLTSNYVMENGAFFYKNRY